MVVVVGIIPIKSNHMLVVIVLGLKNLSLSSKVSHKTAPMDSKEDSMDDLQPDQ